MSGQSKWNWKMLSEYRLQLYGISIISVIIYHYFSYVVSAYPDSGFGKVLNCYNIFIGSIGVEIFLFLSGMGLYFSMSRNSEIKQFYRKRFQRVLIPYLLWGGVYWVWKDILIFHTSARRFLLDYSTLSLWLKGDKSMWYVNFIIMMYLLFPVLFGFLRKESSHRGLFTAMLTCGIFGMTIALRFILPNVYHHIEIELYRIPVFILGVYYGQAVAEKKEISKIDISLMIFGILAKIAYFLGDFLGVRYLNKIPIRLVQCFACLILMFLFAELGKKCMNTKCNTVLTFCGKHSFELYITHAGLIHIIKGYGLAIYEIQSYLICIIGSVLFSIALNKLTDRILQAIKT